MKFAVTGANGFFGHYICRELLAHGHAVRAFVRHRDRARGLDNLGAELALGDFADWDSVARMMSGCDAIVHNGYWQGHRGTLPGEPIDFVKYVEYNILGLYRMLAFCRDAGIANFFHVSSGAALGKAPTAGAGKDDGRPSSFPDETCPAFPETEYSAYKRTVESYVAVFNRQYGMGHFTAFRPMASITGVPRDVTKTWLYREMMSLRRNEPVATDLESRVALCHPRDFARAALAVAGKPPREAVAPLVHLCGPPHGRRDIIETIKQLTGSDARIEHQPPDKPPLAVFSNAVALELGVRFCDMDGVVEQTRELLAYVPSS